MAHLHTPERGADEDRASYIERRKASKRAAKARAALFAQIAECKRSVASWPAWMRQTAHAPTWMLGNASSLDT